MYSTIVVVKCKIIILLTHFLFRKTFLVIINREWFLFKNYGGNNPNIYTQDHGYDIVLLQWQVLKEITDCLLIFILYLLFVEKRQAEEIRKVKDRDSQGFRLVLRQVMFVILLLYDVCFFLLNYDICMYVNILLLITLVINEIHK